MDFTDGYRNGSIGLGLEELKIVPYSPCWPVLFQSERKKITETLKPLEIKIEHIGSTAVPGLVGKPVIDMAGALNDCNEIMQSITVLSDIGYTYLGECGRKGRYFFTKSRNEITFFHMHMVEVSSSYWKDFIRFRDFLRTHWKKAAEYAEEKNKLLHVYGPNRDIYRILKGKWIEERLSPLINSGNVL